MKMSGSGESSPFSSGSADGFCYWGGGAGCEAGLDLHQLLVDVVSELAVGLEAEESARPGRPPKARENKVNRSMMRNPGGTVGGFHRDSLLCLSKQRARRAKERLYACREFSVGWIVEFGASNINHVPEGVRGAFYGQSQEVAVAVITWAPDRIFPLSVKATS